MHASAALAAPVRPLPAWVWCVFGGIALGLADLAFAAVFWSMHSGVAPIRIPQAIAGWVLGPVEARSGGHATALAGAALYCFVVATMVAGYLRVYAHVPRVRGAQRWWAGGWYGIAMYAVLFRLVLPLLAAPAPSRVMPVEWTLACVVAYVGIGLGCAWVARAHFESSNG